MTLCCKCLWNCGDDPEPSGPSLPEPGSWERLLLDEIAKQVDYLADIGADPSVIEIEVPVYATVRIPDSQALLERLQERGLIRITDTITPYRKGG